MLLQVPYLKYLAGRIVNYLELAYLAVTETIPPPTMAHHIWPRAVTWSMGIRSVLLAYVLSGWVSTWISFVSPAIRTQNLLSSINLFIHSPNFGS